MTFKRLLDFVLAIILGITNIVPASWFAETTEYKGDEYALYTCPYYMDENCDFVANIPYEKYIDYSNEDTSVADGQILIVLDSDNLSTDKTAGVANAKVINDAINTVTKAGGGMVYIKGGEYVTNTITVKSNVTLKIAGDAKLISIGFDEHTALKAKKQGLSGGVIRIADAVNVTIEGPGTIDGIGSDFMNEPKKTGGLKVEDVPVFNLKQYNLAWRDYIRYHKGSRAHIIWANNVENLTINNIHLRESGNWNMRIINCTNVDVYNTVIDNNVHVENGDGVNYVGCNDVEMYHCFVVAADDGICLKADTGKSCLDHKIYDCEVMSLANCFKIGTPTVEPVENIEVYDCKFFRAGIMGGYAGIALESADGTDMKNIYIHDIDMDGILSPLLIWLGCRMEHGGTKVGSLRDVTVENITANNVDVPSAVRGCVYEGKNYYVQNVTLRNFNVVYRDSKEDLDLPGPFEHFYLNAAGNVYPDITRVLYLGSSTNNYADSIMKDYPVYGLYAVYVDGLTVENFNVKPRSCNKLPLNNLSRNCDRIEAKNITWK